MVAIRCCSSTLDNPWSSSVSLKSISSISCDRLLDWDASVFLLLFDGADEASLDVDEVGSRRGRLVEGIVGGEESAVRSTKSLKSSVCSGQGVSDRLEWPDGDQKSSDNGVTGRGRSREGGIVGREWKVVVACGRPEVFVLELFPTGSDCSGKFGGSR